MMPSKRAFAAALASFFVVTGCNAALSPGEGRARDVETGAPVAGVEVVLACEKGKGWHSTELVRQVSKTTDAAGIYRFGPDDVRGCSFGTLKASKPGYETLSGTQMLYHSAAGDGFPMIRASEAVAWRVTQMAGVADSFAAKEGGGWTPVVKYREVFGIFVRARALAGSGPARQRVATRLCPVLDRLDAGLTPAQREELAKTRPELSEGRFVALDHAAEVAPYCAAARKAG